MQNDNIIVWQKWIDPFGRDDETKEEFDNYTIEEDEDSEDDTQDKSKIEEFLADKRIRYGVKVITTPMGIIPVNDHTSSSKIFNFWMGHTNFDITRRVAETIEITEGVETLDIYTRYRFRISVGKAFEDSMVMRTINKNVYKELTNAHQ